MPAPSSLLMRCALAVLLVVGVSGCSEPTPATRIPTSSPVPTASSASPSPTVLTPEQEVEAAVRAYYAELTRAAQTNDTSKLKKLVHKECPCYGSARAIDDTRATRRSTPDARWTVREITVREVAGETATVEVKYEVSPFKVLDAAGKTIDEFPRRKSHLDLFLARTKDGWILINVFDLEG